MNDTSPAVRALYLRLMMARSGEERLKMGSDLFDSARALVQANLESQGISEGTTRAKLALFLRTYERDLSPAKVQRIVARYRGSQESVS